MGLRADTQLVEDIGNFPLRDAQGNGNVAPSIRNASSLPWTCSAMYALMTSSVTVSLLRREYPATRQNKPRKHCCRLGNSTEDDRSFSFDLSAVFYNVYFPLSIQKFPVFLIRVLLIPNSWDSM
jgi:hypothetical protein